MAEVRGLLTGNINVVQAKALIMLRAFSEAEQKSRDEGFYLRLALVAGDPATFFGLLFPHLFSTKDDEDVSDLLDDEGLINDPSVTLKFKETPEPERAEEILSRMLGNATGVLTGSSFSTGEGKFWDRNE